MIPFALAGRIPGIVWVGALVVALAGMFVAGIYGAGRRSGERAVRRAALQDSASIVHAKVQASATRMDSTLQIARNWRAGTAGSSAKFETKRAAALTAADTAALLDTAGAMIKRLETTVQTYVIATDAAIAERLTRIEADTIEAHQVALAEPNDERRTVRTVRRVGTAVAVVGVLVWVVTHVKR